MEEAEGNLEYDLCCACSGKRPEKVRKRKWNLTRAEKGLIYRRKERLHLNPFPQRSPPTPLVFLILPFFFLESTAVLSTVLDGAACRFFFSSVTPRHQLLPQRLVRLVQDNLDLEYHTSQESSYTRDPKSSLRRERGRETWFSLILHL